MSKIKRKNMFESFDTHALVSEMKESRDYDLSNLATRKDFLDLKNDIIQWIVSIGFVTIVTIISAMLKYFLQ